MNLFDKKELKDFSKKVKSIFNLMTISRNYKIIGSAGLKNIKYTTDYDLNELYKKPLDTKSALDLIYNHFKSKFNKAENSKNIFITDFKCGVDSNGDPLRWDKNDIKKGYKILADKSKISFQDCILQKATMKLDVVAIIDGKFTEFSDNYLIKLGNDANFYPHDLSKEHIRNNLKKDFHQYFYTKKNYFKGLKRVFNYYLIDGIKKNKRLLTKILHFFNSDVGLLYKIKGEISTIILVMENKNRFRNPKISDVKKAIQIIIDELKDFSENEIFNELKHFLKTKNIKILEDVENKLFKIINGITFDWISKNRDVVPNF